MEDAHEAVMSLGEWFATMLKELEEDSVQDPEAIENLKGRVAAAFAEWRIAWGIGVSGRPGTGPLDD